MNQESTVLVPNDTPDPVTLKPSDTKGCSLRVVINGSGRLQDVGSNIFIPHKLLNKSWVCRGQVDR